MPPARGDLDPTFPFLFANPGFSFPDASICIRSESDVRMRSTTA